MKFCFLFVELQRNLKNSECVVFCGFFFYNQSFIYSLIPENVQYTLHVPSSFLGAGETVLEKSLLRTTANTEM